MSTKGVWPGATGVVRRGHARKALPDDAWCHVQTIVRAEMGRPPPPAFREALDAALQVWQAAKYLQDRGTPKHIRRNLKRATEAALRLNERLNDLDGNSRQLLSQTPGSGIEELYTSVERVVLVLAEAERNAGMFPVTREGIRDYLSLNMGNYLALGMKSHLGHKASLTENDLFASLYEVLARVVSVSDDRKAVRKAIKFIRELDDGESA